MLKSRLRSLIPLACLTTLISAQTNTTTPANGTCRTPDYNIDAPVNASAVLPVYITTAEPWYLTVTLNDTRTNTTASTKIDGWISTPANATGRACVYWLTDLLLAQSSGAPNGSCTGSLSDNCVDFMRRSVVLSSADNCPSLPSKEDFGKACGGSALADGYQAVSTTAPLDVSNSTCTPNRVPGADQPPSAYTNHGLFGVGFGGDESSDAKDPSKFTWYDKYVGQPMPWLVAVEQDGKTSTSVVCAAPRQVQGGAREPVTGGAGRVSVGWLGLGVVGVAMAML